MFCVNVCVCVSVCLVCLLVAPYLSAHKSEQLKAEWLLAPLVPLLIHGHLISFWSNSSSCFVLHSQREWQWKKPLSDWSLIDKKRENFSAIWLKYFLKHRFIVCFRARRKRVCFFSFFFEACMFYGGMFWCFCCCSFLRLVWQGKELLVTRTDRAEGEQTNDWSSRRKLKRKTTATWVVLEQL